MKKLILAALLMMFTLPAHAAVLIYFFRVLDSSGSPTTRISRYYVTDTTLELSGISGAQVADFAYSKGTSLFYTYNGSSWVSVNVAGATTQVMYNSSGTLAGDADFTWNNTGNILTIVGGIDLFALETNATNSHIKTTGTTPAVSACGTSPFVTGTDTAGRITVGSGVGITSCTLTFNTAYSVPAACGISNTATLATSTTVGTSTMVFTTATTMANAVITYVCFSL